MCLEAVQDSLQDSVGVIGEVSIGGVHCVDGAASPVLQDAAHVPQGLVWCVLSAVPFAFLGCGSHAVGMPFLKLHGGG